MRRAVTRHYVVRGDHRVQHDQFARRSLSRLCRHRAQCRRYLWQLRYELLKFGLRPNASGPGAHASLRAQRKREFGDVVAVGGIEDDQQIAVARRKIDLLDLNSHFLGQILSGFGSLGSILDRTDSLIGPVERTHECGHAVLRVHPETSRPAAEAAVNLWAAKRDGDAKKNGGLPKDRACRRHYRCL